MMETSSNTTGYIVTWVLSFTGSNEKNKLFNKIRLLRTYYDND